LGKKTLIAVLAVAIAVTIAACGSSSSSSSTSSSSPGTSNAPKEIGISFPGATQEGAVQFEMKFAQQEATKLGYKTVIDDPGQDQQHQLNTINTWVSQHYPAVLVQALDPGPFQNVVAPAKASGTKWISYGAPMPHQSGYINMNQLQGGNEIGKLAGEWIKKNITGTAQVALLTDEPAAWARAREVGVLQGLKATGAKYTIVAKQDALSQSDGLQATTPMLQAHPNLNVVLAVEETASEGAYQAFINAHYPKDDPKVFLGGIDGTLEALTLLNQGNTMYRGSAAINLQQLGVNMAQTAVKLAQGADNVTYDVQYTPLTAGDPAVAGFLADWQK
jgi:ribose transport system substrate-binding protein